VTGLHVPEYEIIIPRGETRVVRPVQDARIRITTAIGGPVLVPIEKDQLLKISVDKQGVVTWIDLREVLKNQGVASDRAG
jgi:hypothetical protein